MGEVVRPGRIRIRNIHHTTSINMTNTQGKNDVASLSLQDIIGGSEEPLAASEFVIKNVEKNDAVENSPKDEDYVMIPSTNFTRGDIVDVTVSLAISPSYFIIQPNNSAFQLDLLSIDMFDFYEELGGGKTGGGRKAESGSREGKAR